MNVLMQLLILYKQVGLLIIKICMDFLLENVLAPVLPTSLVAFRLENIVTCLSLKSVFSSLVHLHNCFCMLGFYVVLFLCL